MDDILGNIVDNNIKVEFDNNIIICYSTKNILVNNKLSEISGIILDLCKIVSEYYNAIIFNIKNKNGYSENLLLIKNEYINFKKINYNVQLYCLLYNDWFFWNIKTIDSTVISDTNNNRDRLLKIFSKYLKKKYKINNYFDDYEKIYLYNPYTHVSDDEIIIKDNTGINTMTIIDHDLFTFMILVIKKIIEHLNEKLKK